KELFFKNKGFSSHQHILSGDDDLFINEVADKNNVQIVINEQAHTISVPKQTFSLWVRQKKRHLTTGKYYRFGHKLLLSGYPVSFILFIIIFFILIVNISPVHLILGVFIFRYLIQMTIFKLIGKKLASN